MPFVCDKSEGTSDPFSLDKAPAPVVRLSDGGLICLSFSAGDARTDALLAQVPVLLKEGPEPF